MKLTKLFLICCLITLPFFAKASHMMGAEVTYKWLGNKKFELTARAYRDCSGIPFNNPTFMMSDHNGKTISLSFTRTSIEDITIRCADSVNGPCNPQNTTIGYMGVELHTFKDTIDFDASPYNAFPNKNACKIYFSIQQCCRNSAITTINPGNLYVDAMLDICNSKYQNTSPQFKSKNVMQAACNMPFSQNFGSKDFIDFDSLGYELTTPLKDSNTLESYTGSFSNVIPMTPYCGAYGYINCTPQPTAKPSRGFYFNKLSGDIIFTPVDCSEVGVIAMKVSEYRKDSSNKWLLVGYVIRDIQIVVYRGADNNPPIITLSSNYNFKTRQNTCINISTRDSAVSNAPAGNKGDKTFLNIVELPSGASFTYLDSSAKNKTGRLCWKIHDSVYLKFKNKNKLLPLTVEVWDNFCYIPAKVQKSFNIKILPPDSSGFLSINTFLDANKNNHKDSLDAPLPVLLKFKDKNSAYYISTDSKGKIEDSIGIGKINIGLASHPYFSSFTKDTNLLVKMDSFHRLNFAIYLNNGIYGRIYEDANNNCQYDKGELTYKGYKVFTDSNKYVGISDNNGIYYINAPKGSYTLTCDYKPSMLKVNCPSTKIINITINGDSAYQSNDFGISKNMQYMDVSTGINISRLRRGNVCSATFYCVNNGPTTRKNIKLYCPVNSKFDLTYNSSLFALAGSIATIQIDSILPYKTYSIKLDFYVSPTGFKVNDKICFSVKTDSIASANDSVIINNSTQECRIVDAPYDPNEKLISNDSAKTTLDQIINYTVHFQNSGTDTATRIIIKDTIDTRYLDLSKFEMNWSEYPCQAIISGNVINFIFDNINLPFFSKSGDKSIAAFNFTLGLRSNINKELSFTNKAAIYFDFENAIFTRNAIATINSPIVLTNIKKKSICKNESNTLHYKSKVSFNAGNQLILEISDDKGSFISPVIVRTLSTISMNDSINFSIPKSFKGANYTLRLKSTNPAAISIPGSGEITFTANAIPAFSVNSNTSNNIACEKDTLVLSFSNTNYSYKVIRNNVSLSNFNNVIVYSFPIKAVDSFKFIAMENASGCKDTTFFYPRIYTKPIITASILNKKKVYCSGEQIDLIATGGLDYFYTKNNIQLGNKTSLAQYKTTLDITSSYQVIGEDSNGCQNKSDTMMVNVNPTPFATISSYPNPICLGDSATLIYGTALNYDLYKNNAVLLNKTTATKYKVPDLKDGDKYKITAFSDKGCSSNSIEITIAIKPIPSKPIISENNDDISVNGTGAIRWYRNGILLSNNSNIITNAPGGIYTAIATNIEGCSISSNAFVHKNSSISTIIKHQFKIYPNPASQNLTIENEDSDQSFAFSIYDMSGKLILESTGNILKTTIDISGISNGVYTLKIESGTRYLFNQIISIAR